MEKYAALTKLNSIIIQLENDGYFQEADELHDLYVKLAAKKPWYKNPLLMAPALMGSMTIPGRNLADYLQNRELYQATRNLEPFELRDESNIILLWKKFLNTKIDEGHSFLPLNGIFDNIAQIRTQEFAQKYNLPYTPGKLDKELLEATYKKFPNDQLLNTLIKSIRTTSRGKYLLPSEDPFSTDILSQLDYDARDEYLKKYGLEPENIERKIQQRKPQEPKPIITKKKKQTTYGVSESSKKGIPWGTSDQEVYNIFKHIRNKYEGRKSTDPHDTGNLNPNKIPGGGGTKFGITQRNWDGYCMRNKMPLSPVLKITREQAEKVGFEDYKRSGAQILPPNTQIAVADFHFNGGPGNMIIVLRDILKLPPIRVQGLKRDAMVQLIKEQKKLLYPMIVKLIKNQEQDEKFARDIYAGRVKLLAGSKTRKKRKQLVHNRGLLNRINEMAEVTGNETALDEISEKMKDLNPKERLELLKKYKLDRSRYFLPGYGNTVYDKKIREQYEKDT